MPVIQLDPEVVRLLNAEQKTVYRKVRSWSIKVDQVIQHGDSSEMVETMIKNLMSDGYKIGDEIDSAYKIGDEIDSADFVQDVCDLLIEQLELQMIQLSSDSSKNGFLSAVPYLSMWLFTFPVCYLADYIKKNNLLSDNVVRKTWTIVSMIGSSVPLILIGFVDRNVTTVIILLTIGVSLHSFLFSGLLSNHLDLLPKYASLLMGIGNGLKKITTILAALIVGWIVTDKRYKMKTDPRGIVLLINVFDYDDEHFPTRHGSKKDMEDLREFWEKMGFLVQEENRGTKSDIEEAIIKWKNQERMLGVDCGIMMIMAHGRGVSPGSGSVYIHTKDKKTINSEWIVEQMNSVEAFRLHEKPKLLFLLTCR